MEPLIAAILILVAWLALLAGWKVGSLSPRHPWQQPRSRQWKN